MIDLRSDTVTKPCPRMREAMAKAEVGDDVFEEDPTVRRLQEQAADLLGFEAGLFVPSGTMANQVALALHCRPGQEVILETRCHIANYEMRAMSALSGLFPHPVEGKAGVLTADAVEEAIHPDLSYLAPTGCVALENTHNWGGTVMDPEAKNAVVEVARRHHLPIHLDGARIWNAAVALGVNARELASGFDTVMFCFSKGLGAPVGSVLLGSRDAMKAAIRVRKRFGGAMRQVGILAAAGLVALENRHRLGDDHARARRLQEGIDALAGLKAEYGGTNIVMFDIEGGLSASELVARMASRGVAAIPFGPRRIRLVTHLDVNDEDITRALEALEACLGS